MPNQNLGFPPYIQTNNVASQYSLNGELPPEIAVKEQAINRRQQIANLMMQQGLKPLHTGGMAGRRFYVPPSWTQGMEKLANVMAGVYGNYRADKDQGSLADENNKLQADTIKQYLENISPIKTKPATPAQPGAPVPTYEGQTIDNGPMVNVPGQPGGGSFMPENGGALPVAPAQLSEMSRLKQEFPMAAAGMPDQPNIPPQPPAKPNMADIINMRPGPEIPGTPEIPGRDRTAQERVAAAMQLRGKLGNAANPILSMQQHYDAMEQQRADREEARRQHALEFGVNTGLKKREIDQKDDHFNRPSGSTLATIEGQNSREDKKLAQDDKHFQGVSGNTSANIASHERVADLHEKGADQRSLNQVGTQQAIAMQNHQDRLAQIDQNKRHDEQSLELRRQQGLSEAEYKREKLAMEDRHNKSMEDLRKEGLEIQRMGKGNKGQMPVQALKLVNEDLEHIGSMSSINADLKSFEDQLDSGKLDLGLSSNLVGSARNYLGASNESSRNLASFKATMEKQRNASLLLNKGVQTEGDAQRAWNELFANMNDKGVVKQRLQELQRINERAANLKRLNVDNIRKNYGLDPMDTEGYTHQQPAVGGGKPSSNIDALLEKYK